MPVLGYATVGEEDSEGTRVELRRQALEIASECAQRGLDLLGIVREREREHQRPFERPGLGYALEKIAAGEARGIVVADLCRMSHSVPELGRVLEWFAGRDARFVAAVPGLDSKEEAGLLTLRTIIEISRWERQRISDRTRNGMCAARRKGPARVADQPQLTERIGRMRAAGMTLQAIADQLNAEEIPTVRGGAKWRPSSVQAAAGYRRPAVAYPFDPKPRGEVLRAIGGGWK
jgi:DNA invertase Pin-like site-specific DNA recombinase